MTGCLLLLWALWLLSGAKKGRTRCQRGHFLSKRLPTSPSHWILPTSHWPEMDLTATPSCKSVWEEGGVGLVCVLNWALCLFEPNQRRLGGKLAVSARTIASIYFSLAISMSFPHFRQQWPDFLSGNEPASMMSIPLFLPSWNQRMVLQDFASWRKETEMEKQLEYIHPKVWSKLLVISCRLEPWNCPLSVVFTLGFLVFSQIQ